MTWIVMTSSAKMPASCWGEYRNVALVKLRPGGEAPAIITARAKGVEKVWHLGAHFVGKTGRSAYYQKRAWAEAEAERLNAREEAA